MDFARKQLEKYGWSDGKGLGKHENGISCALKPKLKRSAAGIGHDIASDFTEHWWNALYDKAASNVEVEYKNGKTKKIKRKDDGEFEITNSTWRLKKKKKYNEEEQYKDFFVKTEVLTNGGSKTEKVKEEESEDEEAEPRDVLKMTDEELFKACKGRTAHKGARHGLKALGKLARIEQQERMLLTQPKYEGYSHTKKIKKENLTVNDSQVIEDTNLNSDSETTHIKEKAKRKKKKRCLSHENQNCNGNIDMELTGQTEPLLGKIKKREKVNTVDTSEMGEVNRKSKKSKTKNVDVEGDHVNIKCKENEEDGSSIAMEMDDNKAKGDCSGKRLAKKKKKRKNEEL